MQTKVQSLVEQLLSVGIGFIISLAVWEWVVKPLWGLTTNFSDNLGITCLFTVVSIVRGYTLRRVFNRLNNKKNKGARHDTPDWTDGQGPRR